MSDFGKFIVSKLCGLLRKHGGSIVDIRLAFYGDVDCEDSVRRFLAGAQCTAPNCPANMWVFVSGGAAQLTEVLMRAESDLVMGGLLFVKAPPHEIALAAVQRNPQGWCLWEDSTVKDGFVYLFARRKYE